MIRLLRKTAVRWALVYLLLFGVSVGAVLGFVYWRTAGLILARTDAAIAADMAYFARQYNEGGPVQLLEAVGERAGNTTDGVYQLTDFTGRPLAGNLQELPEIPADQTGSFEFMFEAPVSGGFTDHPVRARRVVLSGGLRLLAGRDIDQLHQVQALMRQALGIALALALALGLASGWLISRYMLRRIERVNRTSRAIRAGQLDERIPLTGSGDEFDSLAAELNAMLDQTNRLMREMREVTDNIAHDLKTPLTRLQAGLEDALRSGKGGEEGLEAMRAGVREASSLLDTVNVLLNISRAEAGAGREQMEVLDIVPLLVDLAELYEPAAEEAGLTLETALKGEHRIRVNRQIISQAVSNLLDNAISHARPQGGGAGRLSLEVARKKDRLFIIIADNGPGIPAQDRERVLERFVRLDVSRSRPGAGLGLSIAAAAARLHNGELRLEDNAPGLKAVISLPTN